MRSSLLAAGFFFFSCGVGADQPGEAPPAAPETQAPAEKPDEEWQEVSYYGFRYKGNKIVFCLDTSNSMHLRVTADAVDKYARDKGNTTRPSTRIDLAKEELVKSIRKLSPQKEFAIVFFDGGVSTWPAKGKSLVAATAKAKEEAIAAVKAKELVFGTDIYGALERAFKFYDFDTIILLTDGAPYSLMEKEVNGKTAHGLRDPVRSLPQNILEMVAGLNKRRKALIHALSMQGGNEVFLKKLAEENGGTFRKIDGTGEAPAEEKEEK